MKRKLALASLALLLAATTAPVARDRDDDTPGPSPGAKRDVVIFRSGGPRLGVGIDDIGAERARDLKLKEETGVEVTSVADDSPAAEAGIKQGDVILSYQGNRVESAMQLTRLVRETPRGRTVEIEVATNGAPRTVRVKLGDWDHGPGPGRRMRAHRFEMPHVEIPEVDIPDVPLLEGIPGSLRLGASIESLTDQLAEYFGAKEGGVLVRSVRKGSPGDAAGLRAGDVIVKVDGEKVADQGALRSALRERRGRELKLTVIRDKREQMLTVAPPAKDAEATFGFDERSFPFLAGVDAVKIKKEVRQHLLEAQEQLRKELERMNLEVEAVGDAAEAVEGEVEVIEEEIEEQENDASGEERRRTEEIEDGSGPENEPLEA